jgi:hypothetical protein
VVLHDAIDPVTGDHLTPGERVSWAIQGIIRRWAFLIVVTLITACVWVTRNATALLWWNLGASYLAIVIESIVGLAMFGQTKRDALVIREIRAIARHVETIAERVLTDVEPPQKEAISHAADDTAAGGAQRG